MPDIDNISITYSDAVDNINIDYQSTVDTIQLNLSSAIVTGAAVTSVNALTDAVTLTASGTLTLTTSSNNYFNHFFYHNLNYQNVIVNVFDQQNSLVIADVVNESTNYVNIKALINLTGYKVVAQR
jgi:hypothetical protein